MNRSNTDDLEAGLAQLEPRERYKVVVEFIVESDSPDDAEADIHDIIKEGITILIGDQDRDLIHEYDITEIEPAEINWQM